LAIATDRARISHLRGQEFSDFPGFFRNRQRMGVSMNYSIYSADRATHLKIVVVALIAGIAIVGLNVGLSYRGSLDTASAQTVGIVKAGKTMVMTSSDVVAIR
jgi:hypothetical protein